MQIKMFVIKPTDHNGFLAAVLLVLAAVEMDFGVEFFFFFTHKCCFCFFHSFLFFFIFLA